MDEVNQKLDNILDKIIDINNRLILLENETKDIHQFVPFVGWLDNISKKILTIPKLAWLKNDINKEDLIITEEEVSLIDS
jgi:hypothetical protein